MHNLTHFSLLSVAVIGLIVPQLSAAEVPAVDVSTLPPDAHYVQVKDGHLSLAGERVRYWGFIGHWGLPGGPVRDANLVKPDDSAEVRAKKSAKTHEVIDAMADRVKALGFNFARVWNMAITNDYVPGDGSETDINAYALAALDRNGIRVWATPFGDYGKADPDKDVGLVDDPATAAAWSEAVRSMKDRSPRNADVGAWDPRMRAVHRREMTREANWTNKYKKGAPRLGDDPQNAIWELTNEEWMFSHLVNGSWQSLPRFFVAGLEQTWCRYLKKKYGSDDALTQAWGFLLPAESIDRNTVLLAPLAQPSDGKAFNDGNAAAVAALTARKQTFGRDDFTRQRGADVMQFFVELQTSYKIDRRDHAKTLGKSLRLSPLVLDTGEGFRIQSLWMQQQGDAVSMCSYIWQVAADRQQPGFPFMSGLNEPPRMAMGIPWMEVGRVPGKPFLVYEFQMNNPDKYRAEVPFRIAADGAIQDWDLINWHLFGGPADPADPKGYDGGLSNSVFDPAWAGATVEGVHFKNDEIYAAAMKSAGALFINGALKTADKPTVMTFGTKSLYDPVSADYGRSFGDLGPKIAPTVFRYGCHMLVDPTKSEDTVVGPTVERGLMEANPVRPTSQIAYDWQRGNLRLDAPGGVSWTGFFARHGGPVAFSNGIVMDQVEVINDPGVNYPVTPEELYVSFAVAAQDGKPLAETKQAIMTLVSTSFNYDFKLDEEKVAAGNLGYTGKPYENMNMGGNVPGKPAVAYVRAGARIATGPLKGMRFRMIDWHFTEIASGTLGASLVIPADKPVFTIELTR